MPPSTTSPPLKTDDASGFRHISALDGLRGLAILLILVDHLMWANAVTGSSLFDLLARLRESCWIGVNLFFALSGYLITGILYGTLSSPTFFKTFYARRAVRIFPLFYGFLFVLFALSRPLNFHWNGWQYYELTYTANLALWRWRVPLITPYFNITHFWSLDVEEQFYLIWPFIVYRLRTIRSLVTVALSACAAVLITRAVLTLLQNRFTYQYLNYSPTFSCADNLLFGCALALLLHSKYRAQTLRLAPRVFTVCVVFIFALFVKDSFLDMHRFTMATIGVSALGIGSAALIAMCLRSRSLAESFFANPVLRFFGRYSYGLYVYHYSLHSLSSPLRAWLNDHFHSKAFAVFGSFLLITALCVAVATLSYHFFEVRFLKLKRFFPNYNPGDTPALIQ